MESQFGDTVQFSVSTEAMPDTIRTYPGFATFAEEEAYSRILGGIHFRNSLLTGAAIGRKIGEQAVAKAMRPQS